MAVLTINCDGLNRTAVVVVGRNVTKDVIILCHGSGTNGAAFVRAWGAAGEGCALIAPDALPTSDGNSWVIPGLPKTDIYYPTSAPSDEHDLNLIKALIAYANGRWPNARVWLVGNSKGASLGWGCYSFNVQGISGYWLGLFGAPLSSFYGWGFSEKVDNKEIMPRPISLSHGGPLDVRSQRLGGAESFSVTSELLLKCVSAVKFSDWTNVGIVGGLTLKARIGLGGVVPYREYEIVNGLHKWYPGEQFHIKQFFKSCGFGS